MEDFEFTRTVFWVVLCLGLFAGEVLSTTFVLLFFGVGALVVALARLIGLDSLPWEISLFAASSLGALFIFRDRLKDSFHRPSDEMYKMDENQIITLSADIPGEGEAQIHYQGSLWTAVNERPLALRKGQRVMIARTEGIRLFVVPHEKASK